MVQYRVTYAITRHREESEPVYTPDVAATLAGISRQALEIYRREGLVEPKVRIDGSLGYSISDIRRLARIRRLREEMGLELAAIDVVLHLRSQIVELKRQINEMKRTMERRERELMSEIHRLRRLLADDLPGW
jgi:MerR family transcriptional regulator/heat shock protein HspR